MNPITTTRLRLVPATAELVRLEMENREAFFRQLGVAPAHDWPSEALARALPVFLEKLENDPSLVGWLSWYWILGAPESDQLVGGGGFKGAPIDGGVEIGYETRAAYRRQGFAVEAVGVQVAWALEQPHVTRVSAETQADNAGSIGVLSKVGFAHVGPGSEEGLLRYERRS